MGDESDWIKLPTDEKCVHKAWKARIAGYEEATKLFTTLDSEKSPEYSRYLGLVKKFVTESNAIAQEKGLDAVLAFVENAVCAGKAAGEVCTGVITKCLNASRAKTKEKGLEILMLYIEAEKQEIVQDELLKGIGNKQPKVVQGCIQALRDALRDFGPKTIMIKPIVKNMQKLLEDRDKNTREEAKLLVIEIYRWIGPALKPQLNNLKPVQVTELEAEFEKLPAGKPLQTRFLRSQQDLKAKMEEQAAAGDVADGDAGGATAEPAEEIDPFELMDAVDILAKLPKDFYDKVEAKKWQERKEALEDVLKLAEKPKLEGGDYGDLVRALKKVICKDSNVMLVVVAAKCVTGLATGLRKKFSPYAQVCIEGILEKFKEKKPMVVAALRDAIDAAFLTANLDVCSEACVASLENKNPSIKAETALFLSRCFARCTMATLPKKLLKMFSAPLCKTINDTSPEVREASFQALGTALKVVGEKPLAPFLAEVDSIKMGKIKECCEKAVLIGKSGKPIGGPSNEASAAPAAKSEAAAPAKQPPKAAAAKKTVQGGRPKTAPAGGKGEGKKKAGGADGKGKKSGAGNKEEPTEHILSDETVEEKAAGILPAEVITGLASSNWKDRLASMERFTQEVKGMSAESIPTQVCVRTVCRKPGLKETNFQVLKLKLELLAFLGQNSKFTKTSAQFCLTDIVDKVGDVKNGSYAQEALSCIAEATSLEHVSLEVVRSAFEQKNPKNQSEALNWLAKAIREFGFKVVVKPMIQYLKKAFAATNPAVRTAAITLVGVLHIYMGAPLRVLFEDEKPALLQQIDAEFEKVKGEKPAAPTRGVKPAEAGAEEADEEEDEADGGGGGGGINVADLVPRVDISESIKLELLEEMADKNWKIRGEALQKVISILNDAKFIKPNIEGLPESLNLRLGDANKNLVGVTLNICQTLATAMGPNLKTHVRVIGPGLVGCLGDTKTHLRASAVTTLNVWVEQTGLVPFVEAEIFSDALKKENPNLRTELLGWLAEKLPNYKKLPTELNMCVPQIFSCLEDRNGDVRKKAQEILVPFMVHSGYEPLHRQAGKLKPASKDQIMSILEKARANLPAKPVKKVAPAAAAPPSSAPPAAAATKSDSTYDSDTSSTTSSKQAVPQKAKPKSAPPGGKKGGVPASSKRKKDEEEDTSPVLVANNAKESRIKDEKQLKVLKWNFTTPRGEYVDQLKTQLDSVSNRKFMDQAFHKDFKFHTKAIELLIQVCDQEPEAVIAQLDLLLKWMTLRFFDTNPSVLMKGLEFLQQCFSMLAREEYHLQEFEAAAFIPYLIIKVGENKDNVRRDVREIFKRICKVYPASKMFQYLIDGLKSKNSKQRTECLEELGNQIEIYGINVCQPSPAQALKIIATQIGDRDNSVRSAALNTVVAAYHILGEGVYKYVGSLNDKDLGMLEERIKRSMKNRPPPAAKTSPVAENKPSKMAAPASQAQHTQQKQLPPARQLVRPSVVKKEFALDLEDGESDLVNMPQLVQHDLEEVLEEQPIKLPETRMRPPSPSMKLLTTSNDASAALDLVISQIASNDILTSIQALSQIDAVLKDTDKSERMSGHVDQFLVATSLKLRLAYSKHMGDEDTPEADVIRLNRCLMASLLTLFQSKNLASEASRDVLKDLVYNLVTILLDARLSNLDEGPQLVRVVNVVVVKIVSKSDCTGIMSALIKLLHDCVQIDTCSPKFLDIIMKCLWKLVRMLPDVINELNIERIIYDLHVFLKAFPSHSWKSRASDTPLRTIKTILHSLAKLKGNRILSYLNLIENPQGCEVEMYLHKVLKNTTGDSDAVAVANTRNEQQLNGGDEIRSQKKDSVASTPRTPAGSKQRLTKTTNDMLAVIFNKIGSKENTKEGLNELYDFKLKYPEADINPFLKKCSMFFQNYVERGLKNIEREREGKTESSFNPASISSTNVAQSDANPADFMERLKVLRARCGLDNSQYSETKSDSGNGVPPSVETSMPTSSSAPQLGHLGSSVRKPQSESDASGNSVEKVADLKRRLEMIKKKAGKS